MGRNNGSRTMVKLMKMGLIALVGVVIWGFTPGVVFAAKSHTVICNECHRSSAGPREMGNLCVNCHTKTEIFATTGARFNLATASNALGNNPNPVDGSGAETSHFWGGNSTLQAAAGSAHPPTSFYTSRYSISKNRITCTICHDPHVEEGTMLVRAAVAGDVICQQCHSSWFVPTPNATLTHPIVADYAAVAAAKPNDYRATVINAGSGDVRLVNGGVSCTSCHGTHYADSSSATIDGKTAYNELTLAQGDGNILRSDGPLRTGPTRNGANGTAQLRSNLCQACHTIELHGQGTSGDHMLGCLDCHGGHAYNGGTPNAYILNKMTPGAVPTRINGVNSAAAQITFPNYPNGGSTRTKWADDVAGTADGFCEKCHGDSNSVAMVAKAAEHEAGNTNECSACHKHNDPANLYSFNRDASAATCGQCHGFPPYKNVPGDRTLVPANDGGYAENNSGDANTPYDYVNSTTHEKDETKTGHKVHAGADLPISPAGVGDWYFVGVSGVDNCKVCHGPDAGAAAGGHREAPATRPNTFRDVPFDGIAKTGGMNPVYQLNSPWTCSAVYCHTNGAPYTGASRPTRNYTGVNVTPAWVGTGGSYANGGFGSIYNTASRCASCHGNSTATMTSKSNSPAHQAHMGAATTLNMGKVFDCKICHVNSASSATALAAGAMDGRSGGKHVNGVIDVDFDTVAYNGELTGSTYTATTGVCATYCHNVTGAAGAMAADWDIATDMQCDSCHGGLASDSSGNGGYGPITTGSHGRHILTSGTGPKLLCAECHGAGSDAGTHAGHFDGIVNMKVAVDTGSFGSDSVSICKECHGYDAEPGEVLPVWGNPATTDCATCHAGSSCGADFNGKTPPVFNYARSTGHNRTSGNYPVSGNVPANSNCLDCHAADSAGHWNGTSGDAPMLRSDLGFPATYTGNENAFCGNCHGTAPAHPTRSASVATRNINTHQSKLCAACHNVHGTSNIQMIIASRTEQNTRDNSGTGAYGGTVNFTALTGSDSYDEDDGAVGGAGELNADDLCATCHSAAGGTNHNNLEGTGVTHYQGENCMTCHASHKDSSDAFKLGAGTACNDCHGFPPTSAAHSKHSKSASNDKDIEDRSDCAYCHTGADLYTYDLGIDQAAGGAQGNHGVSRANRQTVMQNNVKVGFNNNGTPTNSADDTCTTACHASSIGDGFWTDANGLNCNACHYTSTTPSGSANTAAGSRAVSAVHNKHFDKNAMACSNCHDVSYSPTLVAVAGPLVHINDASGANEGLQYEGMAKALADEAAVVRTNMTWNDTLNTCSGSGIGLGCHASGTPDWDIVIPNSNAGCLECHTNTTNAAFNPVSGLHNNAVLPTVTGNAHDGSFDNGSGGSADCVTCHSLTPTVVAANHINGTLNIGTAITQQAIVGYTVATADCATSCHSAGTTWRYKWSSTAYNSNGTECANCHGDYASGWTTGVSPHTEFPNRGNKHNNVGNLTYPCSDCHAIGSAGYKWTSKWDPTGANSHHGDDKITMNQVAGVNTFAIDTAPNPDRAGCTTSACHGNSSDYNFRVTTTTFTTQTVTGNPPEVLCSGCHGGTVGTSANGYWPDGANTRADNASEDNSGAHLKHIEALASKVMGQTIAQLLTDNVGVGGAPWNTATSDTKQKELCTYCHGTTSNPIDATHGLLSYLPADVSSMFTLWGKVADNGVYNAGTYTCATVDCHFNKTTPTTNDWYDALGNGTCIMCHLDAPAEAKHAAHTGAVATYGRTISCADCHEAATNWATNTAPASGHLDGNYTVAGAVAFTYTSNSCGTNDCHEDGKGGAPKTNPYPWNGAALSGCGFCHDAAPTTDAHTVHLAAKVSSYVPGSCNDCHTAGSNAAHIDNSVSYAGQISDAPGNGSCTNTCHLSPEAGDWTGGSSAIACTDCHSGSGASAYIGGDKSSVAGPNHMPQYNMHPVTPSVTGKLHTAAGLSTACSTCHTTLAGRATHINGVWAADDADNTNDQHRGLFAGFTDGTIPTCTTACHSVGTAWTYKWSASAALTDGSQCANCHGTFAAGWNSGVMHAGTGARGNGAHTAVGTLGFPCTDCHALGASNGAYPFTYTSNDWAATDASATTKHGDGFITLNSTGTSWARVSGRSGCAGCHEGAEVGGNAHDYPASTWTAQTVAGVAPDVSGSCTACHGGSEYWPDGTVSPDRAGKHEAHVHAIATKMAGGNSAANRNASCDYCHPNPGANGHNTGGGATATVGPFKNILTGAFSDPDGILNAGDSTCSTVDCHFNNAVTPHWYADTYPPAQVTLSAVAVDPATNPRAIKLSWTSPGDDANVANTTVYRYDMRYGTSSGIASDFNSLTNHVGGLPLAYMQGTVQEVLVDNLTPGTTYYFSMRSQDAAGNWSTPSAVVSAVASGDTVKPYFGGVDRAYKGDESATINVEWSHAEDHTMPVTYQLWMKSLAAGPLVMRTDAPLITGIKGYKYQLTAANGVVNDEEYQIGVRACDGVTPTANCDSNIEIVSVTPTAVPLVGKTYPIFRANGAASGGYVGLEKGASFTAAATSALPVTFRPAANQNYPSTYFVDGFSLYITNGNATSTIRATLGYSTGNNFTAFTPAVTAEVSMAARAKGIKGFKLSDIAGKQINSGQSLAVQLTVVSGAVTSVGWGSAANDGTLTAAERLVNVAPTSPNLQGTVTGALVNLTWTESTDGADAVDDTVHYDLYGSDDNGATYEYLIATGLSADTISYTWNTQLHGIALEGAANVAVKIKAGDGYAHTESIKTGLPVNNLADNVAPNAITDLVVKRRAKAGSVMLRWTAPGDDFENNGRAAYYDVRYSTSAITEGNFALATRFYGAPQPTFGGQIQEMEITGLTPLTPYYFAVKTYDEGGNGSPISTPKYTSPSPTDQEIGGPRCGMCHTTAPSVVESVGNHRIHGITIADCVKCHGGAVASFGLDHQDGQLRMGWGAGGPQQAIISGNRVYYTDDGTPGGNVIYDDINGGGGFYNNNYNGIGDGIDNGTCANFAAGCHGPAGSPGYEQPNWISTAKLNCANCHGDPSRVKDSVYNRPFDSNTSGGTVATDQVKGSPPIDNHGLSSGKYVGLHEKHLNYSFRFAKGDSCNLCHPGRYSDKNDLDGKHADGYIDVKLYTVAAGDNALWEAGVDVAPGSCSNMSPNSCHPSASTPIWDSSESFDCVECHGFAGTSPSHVTDPDGTVNTADKGWATDPMVGNCTYCHPGGHPLDDLGGTMLILANSSQVGINYKSGGIHLKKSIGGRAARQTEAELCWQCHDANGISEWGADTGSNNTATVPPNGSNYNYGSVTTSNWTTATWSSPIAEFSYKTGAIQSTHSTHELGTSAVTGAMGSYTETKDTVDKIRCSNCHDVHNMNKAPGDNVSGQPYLRGTWIRNPYPEDGAPWNKAYATVIAGYGPVPRAGGNEMGGYQIDQNNGNPTAGMSLATSAGICTLCHGSNVDTMDKTTGENLWIGTNGHSNATLGGTASAAANIFGNGIGGRAVAVGDANTKVLSATDGKMGAADVYDMGLQIMPNTLGVTTAYGMGYRGNDSQGYAPTISQTRGYNSYQWGATVDQTTTDVGYHAFTCSKCHNPHASRLPKLMITNCLDTSHNTWQSGSNGANGQTQSYWTASTEDSGEMAATWNTAQNCHRYDPNTNGGGGWNKVTPW